MTLIKKAMRWLSLMRQLIASHIIKKIIKTYAPDRFDGGFLYPINIEKFQRG